MTQDLILVIDTKNEGQIITYQRDDGTIIQHSVSTNNSKKFKSWADWLAFVSQRKSSFVSLYLTEFLIKNNIVNSEEILDVKLSIENKENLRNYIKPKIDKFFLEKYPVLIELEKIEPLSLNWKTAPIIDNKPNLKFIDNIIPKGEHTDYGITVNGKLLIYSHYILREQKFTNDDIGFVDDEYIESDFIRWYESLEIGDIILGIHFKKEKITQDRGRITEGTQTFLLKQPITVGEEIKTFLYWDE